MPNTYETKLWGGRFRGDEDALMRISTASAGAPAGWWSRISRQPCPCGLQVKCGLLTSAEGEALTRGLETILADFKAGRLFTPKNTRMCIPLWSCT